MTKKLFITGTDTDAGKTFCACALEAALRARGYSVRPFKPVVAGLEPDGSNRDLACISGPRGCGNRKAPFLPASTGNRWLLILPQ